MMENYKKSEAVAIVREASYVPFNIGCMAIVYA